MPIVLATLPVLVKFAALSSFANFALAKHAKRRPAVPLGGTIDLDKMTVDVEFDSRGRAPRSRLLFPIAERIFEKNLTRYLRGEGPKPTGIEQSALASAIEENVIRLRPFTAIESNALGQSTPAMQSVLFRARANGRRGGLVSARRRRRARPAAKKATVRRAARRRAPRRLVRGSPAARRHMAKLRRMRRRR